MPQVQADLMRRALALGGVLLLCALSLMAIGAAGGSTGFERLAQVWRDPAAAQIVWDIRLPRTLGAWAAGALLGLSGAVAQGLFRNPLADPYLLGSASGSSLGVALTLALFGVSPFASQWLVRLGLTGAAFAGAVGAVLLTLLLAKGVQHTLKLLLAGVIVGVVLGAAIFQVLAIWVESQVLPGSDAGRAWMLLRGVFELAAGGVVLWLAVAWGLVQSLKIRLLAMLHIGFVWLGPPRTGTQAV